MDAGFLLQIINTGHEKLEKICTSPAFNDVWQKQEKISTFPLMLHPKLLSGL